MDKDITSFLLNLLQTKRSNLQYGNENVTQLEHALQCAELTEKNNCSQEIITAALLHDIGHLLYDGEDPIHDGKDGYHENLGAEYLSTYYGEEVTRPIKAHVACKRYLSAVEDGYYEIVQCLRCSSTKSVNFCILCISMHFYVAKVFCTTKCYMQLVFKQLNSAVQCTLSIEQ